MKKETAELKIDQQNMKMFRQWNERNEWNKKVDVNREKVNRFSKNVERKRNKNREQELLRKREKVNTFLSFLFFIWQEQQKKKLFAMI